MQTLPPFAGFPAQAFEFLRGLERCNERAWFQSRRDEYRRWVEAPSLSFVQDLGAALQVVAPTVRPEPVVRGSVFRPHRDIRFSADKRPYKTHVGIRFRDAKGAGSSHCEGPLFYVEIDARRLRLGVGIKKFDAATYRAYASHALEQPSHYLNTLETARARCHSVEGHRARRLRADWHDHPNATLAQRDGFFVLHEMPLPSSISTEGFVGYCEEHFALYAPLFSALREACYLADLLPFSATFTGHLAGAEIILEGVQRNLVGMRTFLGTPPSPQHAILLGMTGAGKSSFMHRLLIETAARYLYTVLIEEGLSYEKFTRMMGARPIILHPDGDITINYFDTSGMPLGQLQIATAVALVARMIGEVPMLRHNKSAKPRSDSISASSTKTLSRNGPSVTVR